MKSKYRRFQLVTVILLVSSTWLPTDLAAQAPPETPRGALLRFLDGDRLIPLSQQRYRLQADGPEYVIFKILDPRPPQPRVLTKVWDPEQPSVLVDRAVLEERRRAAMETNFRAHGWMSSRLAKLVSDVSGDAWVAALFRMRVDENRFDKISILAEGVSPSQLAEQAKQRRHQVETSALERFDQTMQAFEVKTRRLARFGPYIAARVCARDLRNKELRQSDAFVSIGIYNEPRVFDSVPIDASLPATLTQRAHASGITGQGVRIALLESGNLSLSRNYFRRIYVLDDDEGASLHLTMCAAIIAHRAGGESLGYAPDASILVANKKGSYVERYRSLFERKRRRTKEPLLPPHIISMSWHETSEEADDAFPPRDDFFDYVATSYPWPVVVTSAGNGAVDRRFAAGRGFNLLSVGDVRNDGDHFRPNDTMSITSAWRNPRVGDREVPSLVAPGTRHRLLGRDFGGTSAATPVVAAITALAISANETLAPWPEAIRAILQATSNYEGADEFRNSRAFDDRDGTGMVNAEAATRVARRPYQAEGSSEAHVYGRLRTPASGASESNPTNAVDIVVDPGTEGWLATEWSITPEETPTEPRLPMANERRAGAGNPGQRVRVALTWNGRTNFLTPNLGQRPSQLDADLDLFVFEGESFEQPVASSVTLDNSFEALDFLAAPDKEYTIRIYVNGVAEDFSSYFGLAWMRSQR